MKGTYFLGNGAFETREVEIREPEENEVLVRVAACGICGTDVHICKGDKGSAAVTPPVILGHEIAGVVEKTGRNVRDVRAGDHITVDPNIYCGKCYYCRTGKKQLCEHLYAVGVNRDGGFAEYCIVPESQCYRLLPSVPLRFGALAEPLACCLHGNDIAQIRTGDTVCIIGGGTIGLIMLQLAKLSGAAKVILSEPAEKNRGIAEALGADGTIDPTMENLNDRLKELTGMPGVDVVIECVGNPVATRQAFEATRRGATVLLFSVPKAGTTHPLDLESVYLKELRICGSFINPDTQGRAVSMINSGKINFAPLITHSFAVNQVAEAIRMQTSRESVKVIIEP